MIAAVTCAAALGWLAEGHPERAWAPVASAGRAVIGWVQGP